MNLISIIMPAYNAERFIREAVDSVISQTYKNWELLIVDDCSTDATSKIINQYAGLDKRVMLLKKKTNSGPAETRNHALRKATGQYIAFLDSDDAWLPNKLEQQLNIMRDNNSAFTYTRYRRISQMGENVGQLITIPTSLNYKQLLGNTAITTSTVMIDLNQTGTINMKKTYYDDFSCWLDILKQGFTAEGIQQDLVRYRIVGKSVSRNKIFSAKMVWKAYREIEGLSFVLSCWYFFNYTLNAFKKYKTF